MNCHTFRKFSIVLSATCIIFPSLSACGNDTSTASLPDTESTRIQEMSRQMADMQRKIQEMEKRQELPTDMGSTLPDDFNAAFEDEFEDAYGGGYDGYDDYDSYDDGYDGAYPTGPNSYYDGQGNYEYNTSFGGGWSNC